MHLCGVDLIFQSHQYLCPGFRISIESCQGTYQHGAERHENESEDPERRREFSHLHRRVAFLQRRGKRVVPDITVQRTSRNADPDHQGIEDDNNEDHVVGRRVDAVHPRKKNDRVIIDAVHLFHIVKIQLLADLDGRCRGSRRRILYIDAQRLQFLGFHISGFHSRQAAVPDYIFIGIVRGPVDQYKKCIICPFYRGCHILHIQQIRGFRSDDRILKPPHIIIVRIPDLTVGNER